MKDAIIGHSTITNSRNDSNLSEWAVFSNKQEFDAWEKELNRQVKQHNSPNSGMSSVRFLSIDKYEPSQVLSMTFKELKGMDIGTFIKIVNILNNHTTP